MNSYPTLFSPLELGGLSLANRITMAPLFLGYANMDGLVNQRLLEHYQAMGASGAAMVMVENASIHPRGQGSPFTMRIDEDRFVQGLTRLAKVIQEGGAKAGLQINHAGRFAHGTGTPLAPSAVPLGKMVIGLLIRNEHVLLNFNIRNMAPVT